MIRTLLIGLAVAGAAGQVAAQTCPCTGGSRLNATQISSTFSDFRVTSVVSGQTHHLYHGTTGTLIACKLGRNSTMDPSEVVGTWQVIGTGSNATIRYNYSGGASFEYQACGAANQFSFCGVNGAQNFIVNRNIISGQGGAVCTPP